MANLDVMVRRSRIENEFTQVCCFHTLDAAFPKDLFSDYYQMIIETCICVPVLLILFTSWGKIDKLQMLDRVSNLTFPQPVSYNSMLSNA